jgi:hypothetical protein
MENIYENFFKILSGGSEEEIRNFLVENFDKFPEDLKRDIIGVFFEEAVDLAYAEIELKKRLLETTKELERALRLLEDKKKELELKKELGIIDTEE